MEESSLVVLTVKRQAILPGRDSAMIPSITGAMAALIIGKLPLCCISERVGGRFDNPGNENPLQPPVLQRKKHRRGHVEREIMQGL
jgi:hypothetical protein